MELEEDLEKLFLEIADMLVKQGYAGVGIQVSPEEEIEFKELLRRGLFEYERRTGFLAGGAVYNQTVFTYQGKKLYEHLKKQRSG